MHKAVKNKARLLCGLKNANADLTTAKFILYYGPSVADSDIYDLHDSENLIKAEHMDLSKNTVLYLHGYLEDPDVESMHVIAKAYLERKDTNLICLDWGELADGNYIFDAVVNAKQLGPYLAKVLLEMFDHGLNIEKFHIVGHSLGGQMAGIVGREIFKRSKGVLKIKRITGLDPAFPLFYLTAGLAAHLNENDAEFVDVIHTDAWIYGAPSSTGTADFWPNGGKTLQPGCPKRNYKMLSDNDLSSHRRSWWFWAESVADRFPVKFDAVAAKSWDDFKQHKFTETDQAVVMGHHCPATINGDFYLQTNGATPFARGKEGINYVDPKELLGNNNTYEVALPAKTYFGASQIELSTAKFVVHRAPTIADFYPLTESRTLVEHLDMSKNTVLYLHGFIENLKSKSIHVIAEAYLSRNDTNLIVLDWAELADGDYALDAVVNAKKLGPYLGTVLLKMFDYGLDIEKLHVVGHSLGAHVASMVGREILKQTHGAKKLKRITGLDPALALFYFTAGLNKHLTKDDAVFVDVIHTDAWLYGTQ